MITTKKLARYYNGSFVVTIYCDGTKTREHIDHNNKVEFPESIDLKITEVCDLCCSYCHESSRRDGKHAKVEDINNITDNLSAGVEIAVGGGNPLEHSQIEDILVMLKNKGLITNITVNKFHLRDLSKVAFLKNWQKEKLIYGIGISIQGYLPDEIFDDLPENVVWHCILGTSSPFDIMNLERPCKVLLLGDKKYGRGERYFANDQAKIDYWKYHLPMVLSRTDLFVSFDNLAIEQLKLKSILSEETWNRCYMGDEGEFTMYVDAVKMQFAKNSISERIDINNLGIREMFQEVRKT